MHSDQSAPEGHSTITPDLSPAEEARKVIDTETRCHQAEIKEPAFLIAMRCCSDFGTFPNLALDVQTPLSLICQGLLSMEFASAQSDVLFAFETTLFWLWHSVIRQLRALSLAVVRSWWNAWTSYSGFTLQEGDAPSVQERQEHETQPPRPSSIDNSSLVAFASPSDPFSSEKQLKSDLLEGTDYKLVFESTWKLLHQWYGGEPAFVRQWVGGAQPYVEIYALQLIIMRSSDNKEANLFITREV